MNRDLIILYLKSLNNLGIRDTQICKRGSVSDSTLQNLRKGDVSEKKLEQIWYGLDRIWDTIHALHIDAARKVTKPKPTDLMYE